MLIMKQFDIKSDTSPWSGSVDLDNGNKLIVTSCGKPVVELIHPVLIEGQNHSTFDSLLEKYRANELLIRHCVAMAEELVSNYTLLCNLRTGRVTVFDLKLDDVIKSLEVVLTRATKIE